MTDPDSSLLDRFEREVWGSLPHLETNGREAHVVNPTPLVDVTEPLRECAREVYHLDLSDREMVVLGKLESQVFGGSIKARPAVEILHEAIAAGKLRTGQAVFEATSGNFGVALGMTAKVGFDVVALVSRRLQEGVFEELRSSGIKVIDLDVDICPAPGIQLEQNLLTAKAVASNIRSELAQYGFDVQTYDRLLPEIERLLARQDVINLAKLLARGYGGFCPEQYDNELNVLVHERVTAKEIDDQLARLGFSLADFRLVCAFGTGGTSGGLSRYLQARYEKKAVHVVFPLANQDVAGIRTKEKASGLRFYEPKRYAGEHEVDFEQAKRLLKFFARKGYDIGESSALALFAVVQMANFGEGGKYVVILADGIDKYRGSLERSERGEKRFEVTFQEAASNIKEYDSILWTHTTFVPSEDGVKLIADSLGSDGGRVRIVRPGDVERLVNREELPEELVVRPRGSGGKLLLVCMAGGTSLRAAKILSEKGVEAQSLTGGISEISRVSGKPILTLLKPVMQR